MKKKNKHIIIALIILLSSVFMGIGYAVINSVTLDLNTKINLISEKKLFISNVEIHESVNAIGIINNYESTFFDSSIELANNENKDNTYITYLITISNNSTDNYYYVEPTFILGQGTYDNENIIFNVTGLEEDEEIQAGSSKNFFITFRYDNPTNVNNNILNAKINFKFQNSSGTKLSELILKNEEDTSSGLTSYNNKYYFEGTNVNNHIWFNCNEGYTSGEEHCEKWRIVSIEEDKGIKITKNDVVDSTQISTLESISNFWLNETKSQWVRDSKILAQGKVIFDYKNLRPKNETLENSYCIKTSNGCNAYSSNQNMIGLYNNLNVDEDSLIKKFLDNVYYTHGLTNVAKQQIQEYNLGIGLVSNGLNIANILNAENSITCTSNVGLLNMSDYIIASGDDNCKKEFNKYYNSSCKENNWMVITDKQYILVNAKPLPSNDKMQQIWTITQNGSIYSQDATNEFYLRTVVVLDENIKATGTGTIDNPYTLS